MVSNENRIRVVGGATIEGRAPLSDQGGMVVTSVSSPEPSSVESMSSNHVTEVEASVVTQLWHNIISYGRMRSWNR